MQERTASYPYTESYYKELYDDLVALLPGCISRLYESQTECVDALVAQALPAFPGMTEQELRDILQTFLETYDCQNYISVVGNTWHGWSVPYINGVVATPSQLESQCPDGSPPSPVFVPPGATTYFGIGKWTNSGIPDIRHLVLNDPATGDWIADALLARGTLEDLPAEAWVEADDCASCDDPADLEFDCDPVTDYKVFYDKVVTVRDSRPTTCSVDEIDLCPPQICKIVNITVTRTDQCDSLSSPAVTQWEVEIAVCPCTAPFVLLTPGNEDSDPVVLDAYGYASEQDCIDDLEGSNCLGGTAESRCIGNQWRLIRHSIDSGTRVCLGQTCDTSCGPRWCV